MSRWRCRLLGGHLAITKYGDGQVLPVCYLCGASLSPGWDCRDLMVRQPVRVRLKPRTITEWLRRYGKAA